MTDKYFCNNRVNSDRCCCCDIEADYSNDFQLQVNTQDAVDSEDITIAISYSSDDECNIEIGIDSYPSNTPHCVHNEGHSPCVWPV